jgi:uncharacterized protein (TIGR02466 family)
MYANIAVNELFPTPFWTVDLKPEKYEPMNAAIVAAIDDLMSPWPELGVGGTWQTDQDLHLLDEFAELTAVINNAVKGAFEFLEIAYDGFEITGCWANINPKGAKHSNHSHPNNYLSGVYYVKTGKGADRIQFIDPRTQAEIIMPPAKTQNKFNGNKVTVEARDGRLVMFPAYLKHEVPMNTSDENRISIAFNVMFTNYTESMSKPLWKKHSRRQKA